MPRRGTSQRDKPKRKQQGGREANPQNATKTNSSQSQSATRPKPSQSQSRTNYLSNNLIGQTVSVQVKDGDWYQGIYAAPPPNRGFGAILQVCRKIESRNDAGVPQLAHEVIARKVIKPDEILQLYAKEITFVGDMADAGTFRRDSFKTDTAISRSGDIKERSLERWQPDENVPKPVWSDTSTSDHSWDQFSTNEKLFGVKASFDENLYTTKLDKNSEVYRKNEMRAAKLASEISKESSSNVHIASDRGIDMEMDEEALYGAVIREDPKPSSTPESKQPAGEVKSYQPAKPVASKPQAATVAPIQFTPTPRKKVIISSPASPSVPAASEDAKKHINILLCTAMDSRLRVDPSKVDPHWKSTTGSYKSEDTPATYQAVPGYNPYPGAPMGYSPYPQMGFYPPMGGPAVYPAAPPYPMMMGYPPPH